jgi:hypothetical protein
LIQGDDTVLGTSVPIDRNKYEETSAELGYVTKIADGVVFLMHAINPFSGAWTPLASRVYQQTVFNEYGGVAPAVELFSFIARTPPHFWHTNPWAVDVAQLLRNGEPFLHYGVTPATAADALNDPVFMTDLAYALKTTPKRAERFKTFDETTLPRNKLSDAVAALIDDRNEVDLPQLPPDEAWTAAQQLATYMAIPEEERHGLLPSLSGSAATYMQYITTGENHDDDD